MTLAPFDPSLITQQSDAYAFFKLYADAGPIHKGVSAVPGYPHTWYFFGYEESKKLLQADFTEPSLRTDFEALDSQHDYFSPERLAIWQHLGNWSIFQTAPTHGPRRSRLAQGFRQSSVAQLAAFIQTEATRIIVELNSKKYVDIQKEFIIPLSVAVVTKLVGTPPIAPLWLKEIGRSISFAIDFGGTSKNFIEGLAALNELTAYIKEIITWKETHLGNDLLSGLLSKSDTEPPLTEETIMNMMTELLILGQETTSDTLGNAIYSFIQNPQQLTLLQNNPSLIDSAVNEVLRFNASLLFTSTRVLKEDFINGDIHINAGETTTVVIGGCNRDARQFSNPNVFDIQRQSAVPEFTFGYGAHYCIGSHLARLVSKIVLQTLVKHLPNTWVLKEPVIWRLNNNMIGPISLTLTK